MSGIMCLDEPAEPFPRASKEEEERQLRAAVAEQSRWWAQRQADAETMLRACKLAEVGEVDAALALLAEVERQVTPAS